MRRRLFLLGMLLGGLALWREWRRRQHPVTLEGKVVIITGATSGIGREAAHTFAAQGARVVLAARRENVLEEVQQEIAIYGSPTLAVPTDIADTDQRAALLQAVLEAFGRVDVLVNNAGLSYGGWHQDIPPEQVRALVDVNFLGAVALARLVLPVMLRQPGDEQGLRGHIVNVTSMAGRVSSPGMAAYVATRRGLDGFSAALRREVAGTGIRVSSVHPAWTQTPMAAGVDENALHRTGAFWATEHFDHPDVPALAILDTVRYNRRAVSLGGPQIRLGQVVEALAPWLEDLYWRTWVDMDAYIALLRRLGA
ncbi:MAG: SDR family NAD(P)-dependent oxidoreductase [Anaerolineae bacterium]|nr:SDR family NAD(P)-dependent oxidoreductase [Anaerolineae bacterium]